MFRALLAATAATAAGFVAARQLMSNETDLERLPDGVRTPLKAARARLYDARERARMAIAEGRQEKALAEAELTAQYRQQTGRAEQGTISLPRRV